MNETPHPVEAQINVVEASRRISKVLTKAHAYLGYAAFAALALHYLLNLARRQGSSAGFDLGLRSGIRLAHIDPESAQRLVDDEREAHERSEQNGAGGEYEREGASVATPIDARNHPPFQEPKGSIPQAYLDWVGAPVVEGES